MSKYILLLLISCIWGSQFFFVALVTNDVGAFTLSLLKAIIGALCLSFVSLVFKREKSPTDFKLYVGIAFFEVVLPFFLIAQGQKYVSSSIASMLIATVPIITLILFFLFFKMKVSQFQFFSIFLGFLGMVILSWPIQVMDGSGTIFGNVLLLLAAISFALSLILMEKLDNRSPVIHMRNVLWISTIILLPLAFIFERPLHLDIDRLQMASIVILGIFHAGIVYMLYNLLIKKEGALFASFSNYIVPVVGVLMGYFILNESLALQHMVGIFIILCALLLSNKKAIKSD
ncbi:DMT family transporter [Lysinibacillus sphaericus]|uniref:DMT family transporter n=1 Tax=Lysinibacillus sphaericus TaxID=1421 RepID=A0A544ULD4_LYSSH|nr:DMT family transporter [Lysinibacillus sp. SDF0037]TQR34295.1 DMT family transporter [Lysinibacillus sp. SDF0037]